MKRILYLPIILACWACSQSPEAQESSAITQSRQIVLDLMKENQTQGMSVSVSRNGKLVWSEGFGHADVENDVHIDPSKTMFRIGSVSKTLTSAAVGRLMDMHKLDPDATIQTYVPDFPEKRWPLTVKQVAGHIGGVRHYRDNEMMSDIFYPTVTSGLDIFKDDELLFEPGTDYSYSSYGWNLVSAVVEGASGEEFLPFMQREVFDMLGMTATKADYANRDIENRTSFYVLYDNELQDAPYVDNSYKWAGGGFIGSTEDLIRFGHAFMNSGYLTQESMDELMTSQVLTNGDTTNYGMGWVSRIDGKGNRWYGHSGGSVGGITQFRIYPDAQLVIAMTSNTSPLNYDGAHERIAWLFIGENVN